MKFVSFYVDDTEWELFKHRVGQRQASSQLRSYIESFNQIFGKDPKDQEGELELRKALATKEGELKALRSQVAVIDAKALKEGQARKIDEEQLLESVRRANRKAIKDKIRYDAMMGKI
jgi:hypothetical protein